MTDKETLEENKLRQLFKNRSNCYADADEVVQAMDEDCFISTINEWQQEQHKNKYSEEEVLKLILTSGKLPFANNEERIQWFEQNKKK
jgi:hypothetical protein